MINERFEDPGSFVIRLDRSKLADDEVRGLAEFGHIVVLPQWHPNPGIYADADLLAAAKYSGVLLKRGLDESGDVLLEGQGLVWHLGDALGLGPTVGAKRTFTAAAVTAVLTSTASGGILPPSITAGTITTTGVGTFTGTFYATTSCLSALRTVMAQLGMHFRINPNGTLDACLASRDEVFVVTSPTVVAVPRGFGADSSYSGVEPTGLRSTVDASRWASTSVVEQTEADDSTSVLSSSTRSHSYLDIHGNALARSVVQSAPASEDVGYTTLHSQTLGAWGLVKEQEINTDQLEFSGPFKVGDWMWVFDPARGFIDTANQIHFRGQFLSPLKVQAVEDEYPPAGGVYYRSKAGAWVDLTRAVRL